MRFLAILPMLLAPLAAQTTVGPSAASEETLARFQRRLVGTRGRLLLRPAGDAAFTRKLADLLKQAPLDDLNLETTTLALDSRLEQECAERLRLQPGPCWVLVGPGFDILAQGRTIPSQPAALAATLQAAGWKSQMEVLSEFLRRHPDHLEARAQQVIILHRSALRRIRPFLAPGPQETLRRPLTDDEDAQVFGAYARALDRFLSDPAFPLANLPLPMISPTLGSHLVTAVARRRMPDVERLLRQHPKSQTLWGVWARLQDLSPTTDPIAFISSIPTLDGAPPRLGFGVLPLLLQSTRRTGRWEKLLPLAETAWEDSRNPLREYEDRPDFQRAWERDAGILVETLLRLGRAQEAQVVVQDFLDWSSHAPAASWAASLATTCGHEAFATRLAALTPAPDAGRLFAGLPEPTTQNSRPARNYASRRDPWGNLPLKDLQFPGKNPVLIRLLNRPAPIRDPKRPITEDLSQAQQTEEDTWEQNRMLLNILDPAFPDPRVLHLGSRTGTELREREGWGEEGRWAILDPKGSVLETGSTVLAAEDLLERMQRHGYQSRHQRIVALLRAHPDHGTTLHEHFLSHGQSAQAIHTWNAHVDQIRRFTKENATQAEPGSDPRRAESLKATGPETSSGFRKLFIERMQNLRNATPSIRPDPRDPETDWAEAARALRLLVEQSGWAIALDYPHRFPEEARRSPSMKRAAHSAQTATETLLLRCPGNFELWGFWLELCAFTEASPLDLYNRAVDAPGLTGKNNERIRHEITRAMVVQERWEEVRNWVEALWEIWKEDPPGRKAAWVIGFQEVILAELKLGRPDRAEAWIQRMLEASPNHASWIFLMASSAASQAGEEALAKAWDKRLAEIQKQQMERQQSPSTRP